MALETWQCWCHHFLHLLQLTSSLFSKHAGSSTSFSGQCPPQIYATHICLDASTHIATKYVNLVRLDMERMTFLVEDASTCGTLVLVVPTALAHMASSCCTPSFDRDGGTIPCWRFHGYVSVTVYSNSLHLARNFVLVNDCDGQHGGRHSLMCIHSRNVAQRHQFHNLHTMRPATGPNCHPDDT